MKANVCIVLCHHSLLCQLLRRSGLTIMAGHFSKLHMNFQPVAGVTGQHVPSYMLCIATYIVSSKMIIIMLRPKII